MPSSDPREDLSTEIRVSVCFQSGLLFYYFQNIWKWEAPLAQLVECQTFDSKVRVQVSPGVGCCVLEQDSSSLLLSTGSTQENAPA